MCLYLVENPRKKEFVDSELARSHVSKFYWWVAIRKMGGLASSFPFTYAMMLMGSLSLIGFRGLIVARISFSF